VNRDHNYLLLAGAKPGPACSIEKSISSDVEKYIRISQPPLSVRTIPSALCISKKFFRIYAEVAAVSRPEERRMKVETMTKILLAAGLAIGLGSGVAYAQTAGQDMHDAGHSTKNAAVDTGHATKRVARKTGHGTKVAARKTVHGTKRAAVATGHRTENVGDAIVGKPEQH
jgi:hypothetical protein